MPVGQIYVNVSVKKHWWFAPAMGLAKAAVKCRLVSGERAVGWLVKFGVMVTVGGK